MKKNKYSKEMGFTLAELLIVVAIIAVLVAVSIPIFANRLAKAKETVCINERTTMKHLCVIESISDEKNWNDFINENGAANNSEAAAKVIMEYLAANNSIDVFECPSKGKITATVNEKGNSVAFFCSVHNGNGSGGGSTGSATENIQEELEKLLEEFAKNYTGRNDNTSFLQTFFDKNKDYQLKNGKPSDVLNDSMIKKWLDNINPAVREKASETIKKYADNEYAVVPYYAPKAGIITYYAESKNPFHAGGTCHTNTNMICYKGNWYANTNLNGPGTDIQPKYLTWLNQVEADKFEETAEKNGWIKLS